MTSPSNYGTLLNCWNYLWMLFGCFFNAYFLEKWGESGFFWICCWSVLIWCWIFVLLQFVMQFTIWNPLKVTCSWLKLTKELKCCKTHSTQPSFSLKTDFAFPLSTKIPKSLFLSDLRRLNKESSASLIIICLKNSLKITVWMADKREVKLLHQL